MSSIGSLASPGSVLPGLPSDRSSAPSSQRSVFERILMHSVASSGFGDGFDASDFASFSPAPTVAPAPTIEAPRFTLRDSPNLASNHRWSPPAMFGNFPEALSVFDEPASSSHMPAPSGAMDWRKPTHGPSLFSQFGGMISSAWAVSREARPLRFTQICQKQSQTPRSLSFKPKGMPLTMAWVLAMLW